MDTHDLEHNSAGADAEGDREGLHPPQEVTLRLREEELVADKRTVQIGRVRLRRELITETRTIEVSVTREEFTLEHLSDTHVDSGHPIDSSEGLGAQLHALAPGDIVRLPLVEEEIIVQKRPVVTRELVVGKRLVKDIREFSDTVRREDARITFEPTSPDPGMEQPPGQLAAYLATGSTPLRQRPGSPLGQNEEQQRTLALREEEMHVRTDTVEKGVVKVQTGVLLERGSVAADLLHEEVTVEEHVVDAHPSERELYGGDTYEVPEYGEQVSLSKRPVVVEEITIEVEAAQEIQEITTTLRREKAALEVQGDVPLTQTKRGLTPHGE